MVPSVKAGNSKASLHLFGDNRRPSAGVHRYAFVFFEEDYNIQWNIYCILLPTHLLAFTLAYLKEKRKNIYCATVCLGGFRF